MNRFLSLYLQLLVAQYGRLKVMKALAEAESVDLSTIQKEVESLAASAEKKAKSRRQRRRKTPHELVEAAGLPSDIEPLVERIAVGYQSRDFLPELWRVRKFLESEGVDAGRLRSRADALPKVIAVLGHWSADRLAELISEWEDGNPGGDLAVLADAIMRPVRKGASDGGGE